MKNEKGAIITSLLMIAIIIFIIWFFFINKIDDDPVPDNIRMNIENAMVQSGYDKNKIIKIMPESDWQSGPRYKIDYDNKIYIVYAYDNGEIKSINDSKMNEIYENKSATGIKANAVKENDIVLIEGELGQFGKEDDFGSSKHIRYYLPSGTYKVKALVRGSQFFIEKIEIAKNSYGKSESEMVRNVYLNGEDDEETITINEDECILLTINTRISLIKQ